MHVCLVLTVSINCYTHIIIIECNVSSVILSTFYPVHRLDTFNTSVLFMLIIVCYVKLLNVLWQVSL